MRDFDDLRRVLGRPARRLNLAGLAVLLAATVAGSLAVLLGANRVVAATLPVVIIVGGIGWLWVRFLESPRAAAAEALLHHDLIERARWRLRTGSSPPRSRAAAVRWLARNPEPAAPYAADLAGRAELLAWIGDSPSASRTLNRIRPESPADRFDHLVARANLDVLDGRAPDLRPIQEALIQLDERDERRHRRVCLALVEARLAVADGTDPWAPICAARKDMDRVMPAATLLSLTVRVVALMAVLSGLEATVFATVGR